MDNRIRFPGPRINFESDVGVSSPPQDHDNYPAPGQQARYDWLRIAIIGLLSQQSSSQPPTQYRDGTPWLDTSTTPPVLKIRINPDWVNYTDALQVDDNGQLSKLTDWIANANVLLSNLAPEITFSGIASNLATKITVPAALQSVLTIYSHAFVWINGLLLDPRSCIIQTNLVNLQPNRLITGDRFTVLIKQFQANHFHQPDTPAP